MAALSLNDKAHLLGRGHVSARFWGAAVSWQLERIEGHLRLLRETEDRAGVPAIPVYDAAQPIHAYDALGIETHFLLIAVRSVLRALTRQQKELGSDGRLDAAYRAFDERFEHARLLRDVLEHFDEYAVGAGRHQDQVGPEPRGVQPCFVQRANDDGDVANLEFTLGALSVSVADLADAAIQLAVTVEEVRRDRMSAS